MNPLGSGYKTIVTELGNGLVSLGYKVICLGLGYNGTEHWNKFSLLPTRGIQEIEVMAGNLKNMKEIELAIAAVAVKPARGTMRRSSRRKNPDTISPTCKYSTKESPQGRSAPG